ncbi:unnamed protein product [Phytophthora fragariaefolia]|uniref:Unnamed protein product n=1 Tax=Phytophthora fragariaefolia TaxID=1490495 RepID=A0A9W7CM18_9STRA|nr:unnamed protein product [Phytophthora fragariaefolia]
MTNSTIYSVLDGKLLTSDLRGILESDDTHSETCTPSKSVAQTQTAAPTQPVVSHQTVLPSELDTYPSIVDEVTAQEDNVTRGRVMIPYGCAVNVSKVDSVDHHLKDSDKASSNSDEQSATSAQSQNGLQNAALATTTAS